MATPNLGVLQKWIILTHLLQKCVSLLINYMTMLVC